MAGSELEYYPFRNSYREAASNGYSGLEPAGWYLEDYHLLQGTREEDFNAAVRRHLNHSGVPVESSKGEWGLGQHELNLSYSDVRTMADRARGVRPFGFRLGEEEILRAHMTPPLIGVTTYARDQENEFHLPAEYVEAIERANGVPALIPHGRLEARHWIDRCDGLILTGGGDLDPTLYGGQPHESIYMVDGERDRNETALILEAIHQQLPVLAICRGIQVLNVALGGSLHPHLPDVVGETIKHRLPPRLPTPHPVTVRSGTLLSGVLSCSDCNPVSWHHQAIQTPADSLEVVAHAPDGTIEAVELPVHPWLIGVQWHPELSAAQDPVQQSLFDHLVRAANGEGGEV